jgi:hypothetical protein
MERIDKGKVSLVEFLNSIKFARRDKTNQTGQCPTHFAHFNPRTRNTLAPKAEDSQLIRSAN